MFPCDSRKVVTRQKTIFCNIRLYSTSDASFAPSIDLLCHYKEAKCLRNAYTDHSAIARAYKSLFKV